MAQKQVKKNAKLKVSTKLFLGGVLLVTLIACGLMVYHLIDPYRIDGYDEMEHISASRIFNTEINTTYYVFFYNALCTECLDYDIEEDVVRYANYVRQNDAINIYMIDMSDAANHNLIGRTCAPEDACNNLFTSNATNYSQIKVGTTPAMIKITNQRLSAPSYQTPITIATELHRASKP